MTSPEHHDRGGDEQGKETCIRFPTSTEAGLSGSPNLKCDTRSVPSTIADRQIATATEPSSKRAQVQNVSLPFQMTSDVLDSGAPIVQPATKLIKEQLRAAIQSEDSCAINDQDDDLLPSPIPPTLSACSSKTDLRSEHAPTRKPSPSKVKQWIVTLFAGNRKASAGSSSRLSTPAMPLQSSLSRFTSAPMLRKAHTHEPTPSNSGSTTMVSKDPSPTGSLISLPGKKLTASDVFNQMDWGAPTWKGSSTAKILEQKDIYGPRKHTKFRNPPGAPPPIEAAGDGRPVLRVQEPGRGEGRICARGGENIGRAQQLAELSFEKRSVGPVKNPNMRFWPGMPETLDLGAMDTYVWLAENAWLDGNGDVRTPETHERVLAAQARKSESAGSPVSRETEPKSKANEEPVPFGPDGNRDENPQRSRESRSLSLSLLTAAFSPTNPPTPRASTV